MSMTQNAAAALFGLSMPAFWSLSGLAVSPLPSATTAPAMSFGTTSIITGFYTLMQQAAANGWSWQSEDLPRCNWGMMGATVCGAYRRQPFLGAGGRGGLFELKALGGL
jgi:hypothetical protein